MKIGIVGSREFKNYAQLQLTVDGYISPDDEIVSGGALGADTFAQRYAKESGRTITIHYPNYGKFGKPATFIRNTKIADSADVLIAFYQVDRFGVGGTKDTVDKARKLNKKVIEIEELRG